MSVIRATANNDLNQKQTPRLIVSEEVKQQDGVKTTQSDGSMVVFQKNSIILLVLTVISKCTDVRMVLWFYGSLTKKANECNIFPNPFRK